MLSLSQPAPAARTARPWHAAAVLAVAASATAPSQHACNGKPKPEHDRAPPHETEGARQTAQAMWPVGAAIEALLNDVTPQEIICCLPFATGKDCATFGLRRYERGEAWALGSAANVGSCRAAAEALDDNRGERRVLASLLSSRSTRTSRMEC